MKKLFTLTALAAACSTTTFSHADNKLEEVIVTSSRVEMPLRQIGTSVSSISGPQIRELGFNSLYDVLRTQPAVAVSNTGGAGKQSSLRIRGEEGYRTKVYLDGIDISDAGGTQSGPKFEQILSSGVERVEILRGPQGLMYGADAGGIVNITTQAPAQGLIGDVSAEAGRYGTEQLAANLGGGNQAVDFNLSATDYQTDGFNARTSDTVLEDDDGYENTTLHGRLGWNVTEKLRLQVVARDIDGENEYDDCSTASYDPTDRCSDSFDQSAWRAEVDYNSDSFNNKLYYDGNDTKREFYAEGDLSFYAEGELERIGYLGSYQHSDALRLIYGADFETSSIDDGTFDNDRDQDGYYLEYQGGFNQLFVTAGLRYDDNEDFGTHTSYRLSGAYIIDLSASELKLKATYGTGFRAPSLYEIAYNGGSFAYPPASLVSLKEEQSSGYDMGVVWSADSGLYLEAVYFDQQVDDEIYFDPIDYSGYLQGDGSSKSKGIELIGELPLLESLTLSANYTYNDSENSDGDRRVRRPENLVNIGLNWRTLDQRLQLGLNVRGSYDAIETDGEALDDYEVVDINASFTIFEALTLYGRVENLFDTDYQEVRTFNTSGTAAYAGVRYSF